MTDAIEQRLTESSIDDCSVSTKIPQAPGLTAYVCRGVFVRNGDTCRGWFYADGLRIVSGPVNVVCRPEYPWQGK